ncbi:endonuclease domain-containing protein [uncultured Enterovirga sp.]|uniref:endonuclease domain-containing protein n=1 Tax=uncultured Enterovirga sp. TaxID=2026352 RepID=UPI0035C9A110
MSASDISDPGDAPDHRARSKPRGLRGSLREPEKKLWWHLRNLPEREAKFQRQVSLGPYVAEFCCVPARLILELDDGGQHGLTEPSETDLLRTAELERHGFRVMRFTNREVITSIDAVLVRIRVALRPENRPRKPRPVVTAPVLLKGKRKA